MKPLSQLPSEEALRQLKESGLGMAQERYRALKLLGSAGDAEVDSLGESMIQINLQNPALKNQLPSSSVPNGTLGIQGGQQSQSAPVQNSNDELEPKPVDLAPTDMLLGSFPRALNQIPDGLASRIMQQWPLHSSHADLGDLELTRLRDLQIPKIHRGKYCLGIIAKGPISRNGDCCMMVFIDTYGDAIFCRISYFEVLPISLRPATDEQIKHTPTTGTFVAIKEPSLKTVASVPQLRVDTLPDLVSLRADDPRLWGPGKISASFPYKNLVLMVAPDTPFEDFRVQGNDAFQRGRWTQAELSYTEGLWQHEKHAKAFLLYLNRSASRLHLERYQSAYEDAARASKLIASSASKLATPDQKRKALLRQAKALYGMEQWKSCQEVLNELQTTFPDPGQDHQDLFSKIKQRLLEQTQGAYDFPALFRQLCNKKPRLEVATYDGPFEIKPSLIPGAGRGAFATRDIQPGELVMADKALVSAWETEPMKQITVVDIPRSRATPPLQTQLAAELMFKQFYGHPSVREKMLQLSTKGFEDLDMSTLSGIDPDRTQGVAIGYAFTLSAPPAATDNTVEGEGVFYNVSFINSQCTPNCVWMPFGDVMLVKALRPIAAGEELYLNYIAYDTLLQRSEKISAWFPVCACPDCQRDRSATPEALQKRHKLMNADCLHEWVEGNLQYLYRTLKTVQEYTEQVKSTFSPQLLSSETPFELGILYDKEGDVHAIIGRHLHSQEEFKKAIRCRKKALEGFGVQLKQAAWKIKHGSDLPVVTLPLRRFERIINICTSLQGLYALLGHSKAEETAWLKAGEWINDSIVAPGLYNLMHG